MMKKLFWLWVLLAFIAGAGISYFAWGYVNKPCEEKITEQEEKKDMLEEYKWSEMEEGPYKDKISFATSSNLTDWTDNGKILAEHASVPDVIYKNGTLYVYFVDVSTDGIKEQVGLITSKDNGKTWSDRQIIKIDGLGEKSAVDPAPYLLENGDIRLYYFDISTTKTQGKDNNTMYSATSSDGMNFKEDGVAWKYADIFDPDVIKVGDTWTMYAGTSDQRVLYAESSDGLNFEYKGVAFEEGAIPNVILENGTYYLFTDGITISTSKDGKSFTKTGNVFDIGKLTADPGIVKLGNNDYFMIYKTSDFMKDDGGEQPENPPLN